MKQKVMAVCLFVIIVSLVIINTVILQKETDALKEAIQELKVEQDDAMEKALQLDCEFRKKVNFIGLTVSHDDLTNIEDCFSELTGYLSIGDTEGAEVTRYRLVRFLEHLRRLVGFNIDAII